MASATETLALLWDSKTKDLQHHHRAEIHRSAFQCKDSIRC